MARSNETLTSLADFAEVKKAPSRARAIQLLQYGHQLMATMRDAEQRLRETKNELAQIQILNDAEGLRYGDLCFMSSTISGRRSLDRTLLLENGVSPSQIEASMKQGESSLRMELCKIGEKE
jgi:hypothetical protein